MNQRHRVGVVGARGFTGRELCARILQHPHLTLAYAASGKVAGTNVLEHWPDLASLVGAPHCDGLLFETPSPQGLQDANLDVVFLALPNGHSDLYVKAAGNALVIDLSADHRFDDAWTYGLVERNREALRQSRHIANPGCYATGLQLAIAPFLNVLSSPPRVFGVSGFSGAGTTPSEKNDPSVLRDNLLAYGLAGHVHEREATRHLGTPVHFMPHVAPWFRGIHLTIDLTFTSPLSSEQMLRRLDDAYESEALVKVQPAPPRVRDIVGHPHVAIGGVCAEEEAQRGVVIATIDNLAKGAAVQALQNMNVALGFDEDSGLALPSRLSTVAPD